MVEGEQLGAYQLVRRIGAGGMGEVWLAHQPLLQRRVAIKVLHPQLSTREELVTRLFNEAKAANSIADPGIVQIYDFGRLAAGAAYLVMEMLDGETLDARMRRSAFRVDDALRIVRQIATTVGAAHARGIVHRDLKPDNVFLVRDAAVMGGERTKILDFGIAKLADSNLTKTAAVMGTPAFMSPEQCRGAGDVDARTDIYALGVVLFMLISGRLPFDATGSGDMLVKHMTVEAPRLSTFVHVPQAVDDLVACCLEKDPDRRIGTGTALANAIGQVLRDPVGAPIVPLPPVAETVAVARPAPTTLSGAASSVVMRTKPPRVMSPMLWAGAGATVLSVGAVLALALMGGPSEVDVAPVHAATPAAPDADLHDLLVAFTRWSTTHAGAPCPTAAELGFRKLALTCTDQPADQIIGAIAPGPDGVLGTADDVKSWTVPAPRRSCPARAGTSRRQELRTPQVLPGAATCGRRVGVARGMHPRCSVADATLVLPMDPDRVSDTMSMAPRAVDAATDHAYLLVVENGSSSMFDLPGLGVVTIGRGAEAELRLDHASVSRRHARILIEGGELRVSDLDSHNGTLVNGLPIDGSRALVTGDVVTVGEVVLVVHARARRASGCEILDERSWRRRFDDEVARAVEFKRPLAILSVHGGSAAPLAKILRTIDVLGTVTDGEILVCLPEADRAAAGRMAAVVASALGAQARIGVATCPFDANDADSLVLAARAGARLARPGGVGAGGDAFERLALGEREVLLAHPAMVRVYELLQRLASADLGGADHRRDRRRQGERGVRRAPPFAAARAAVRRAQLRGVAGAARREPAVRPRQGRVHRRDRAEAGPARERRRRHAVPRRGRRARAVRCRRSYCARSRRRRSHAHRRAQGERPVDVRLR